MKLTELEDPMNQASAAQNHAYSRTIKAQSFVRCYESPQSAASQSSYNPATCPSPPRPSICILHSRVSSLHIPKLRAAQITLAFAFTIVQLPPERHRATTYVLASFYIVPCMFLMANVSYPMFNISFLGLMAVRKPFPRTPPTSSIASSSLAH